jgi:hypothetical protein
LRFLFAEWWRGRGSGGRREDFCLKFSGYITERYLSNSYT